MILCGFVRQCTRISRLTLQKSASGKFAGIDTDKRADGQETDEWLTLLPRLEGGRCNGAKCKSEAEAGS